MCIDMTGETLMWVLIFGNGIAICFLFIVIVQLVELYVKFDLEKSDFQDFKNKLTNKKSDFGNN